MNKVGESNGNRQRLLRKTAAAGSDANSRIWILKCLDCAFVYGCNNTDAWERKCPKCQGGRNGSPIPTERDGEDWNRDEHVIAFNLYCQIPLGTIHMRNPKIIELAALLGRKVGSVSNKLANLSRHDPALQARDIQGLPHGAKGEAQVWAEFVHQPESLAFESARLLAEKLGLSVAVVADVEVDDLPVEGKEREAILRVRVNQSFFRRRVLSSYGFRCCVTGLTQNELLVASHIVPWAKDAANRMNPRNGLCLNALHDKAFDRGLMWIEDGFTIRLAPRLRELDDESKRTVDWLVSFDGKPLLLPKRFKPDTGFLATHAASCLR